MTDPILELVSLVKRHDSVLAVDHVSFAVYRGEFFSILGPSGAGKTSVLRMIAGFESPDEGEIRIDGRSIRGSRLIIVPSTWYFSPTRYSLI